MKNDYSQNQIITAKYCCHKIIDGSRLRNLNSSKRRASLFLYQAIYFTKAIFRELLYIILQDLFMVIIIKRKEIKASYDAINADD